MRLLTMFLLAGSPANPSDLLIKGAEDFDLSRAKSRQPCSATSAEAIVVCGRRAKAQEVIVRNPGQFESRQLRAETGLGSGATLDMHAEQHSRPDGRSGPAVMVRIKTPF
jgi:hypothetical protein